MHKSVAHRWGSTGNTWDVCVNGTGAVGCGNQETFRNCADVAIITNTGGFGPSGVVPAAPTSLHDNPYAIKLLNVTQKGVQEQTLVVRSVNSRNTLLAGISISQFNANKNIDFLDLKYALQTTALGTRINLIHGVWPTA